MPQKNITIEISMGTIVKSVLFVLLLIGLYFIRNIVSVVLFSIVVASAVEPATIWFGKRRVPRTVAVLLVYIISFSLLGSIFYLIVPTFITELSNFANALPQYLSNPTSFQKLFSFLPFSDGSVAVILHEALDVASSKMSNATSGFFRAAVNMFGGVLSFALTVVLSFYLSVQKNGLENFLKIITPVQYENYILDLWGRSRKKVGLWIQGQILLAVLIGVLVFLGLTILGVEYALSLGLLAAVFELLPIFGPILAAIPAVAVAFLESPALALAVVGLYVIIQQFEGHLIYPLVVKKIVGVPAILVILAILIGGTIGGLFGILLAIPVATVLMEFLTDVSAKKHLSVQ